LHKVNKNSDIDIKSIRDKLDLTQEELARKLGVSLSTVSRWETGGSMPSQLAKRRLLDLANGISN